MTISTPIPSARESMYEVARCAVFYKTKERYGALSNMAGGFPLEVAGVRIPSSEALYQACRFPHLPDVQQKIIDQKSPMTAKMVSKPHRQETRPDWETDRIPIMAWCLRVKLLQNWDAFSHALAETAARPIVEKSRRDRFWGAIPFSEDETQLVGSNMLGKLLTDLRQDVRRGRFSKDALLDPPLLREFTLLGRRIPSIKTGDRID